MYADATQGMRPPVFLIGILDVWQGIVWEWWLLPQAQAHAIRDNNASAMNAMHLETALINLHIFSCDHATLELDVSVCPSVTFLFSAPANLSVSYCSCLNNFFMILLSLPTLHATSCWIFFNSLSSLDFIKKIIKLIVIVRKKNWHSFNVCFQSITVGKKS